MASYHRDRRSAPRTSVNLLVQWYARPVFVEQPTRALKRTLGFVATTLFTLTGFMISSTGQLAPEMWLRRTLTQITRVSG